MSREAWGDEDPADSLCAVDGCGCKARAGEETCAEHRDTFECLCCGEWVDEDRLNESHASCECGECAVILPKQGDGQNPGVGPVCEVRA